MNTVTVLSMENWTAKELVWGPSCNGILLRGTNFWAENWSPTEKFGTALDNFSMENWSYSYKTVEEPFKMTQTLPNQRNDLGKYEGEENIFVF